MAGPDDDASHDASAREADEPAGSAPGEPRFPQRAGRGRSHRVAPWLVVTLPLAFAGTGVAGMAVGASGRPSPPSCVTGPENAATMDTLLAARDAWLLRGGPLPPLSGRPAELRERTRGVPVTSWSSSVVGFVPSSPTFRARVTLRYRLAGDTVDTVRQREVGAVRGGGCWTLRDDDPAPGAVPDLWDLGPVRVERAGGVVVIASAGLAGGAARGIAADASRAQEAVEAVWSPVRSPVVVLAPRRTDDAAAVAGTPRAALTGLAAVTYGPPPGSAGPSAFGSTRVVVVPDGFAALDEQGRRFVLAHELTHAATNAAARAAVPVWFQECFADVVGWSALGLGAARVDEIVGEDLRAARLDRLPARLPTGADFDPRTGAPDRAYALADAACLALGDGPRAQRLADVYRAAAGVTPSGSGPVTTAPAAPSSDASSSPSSGPSSGAGAAVLAAAGTDERRLLAAWHRRVVALAGPIPGSTP